MQILYCFLWLTTLCFFSGTGGHNRIKSFFEKWSDRIISSIEYSYSYSPFLFLTSRYQVGSSFCSSEAANYYSHFCRL
jgi:hypothetical protein